MANNKQRHIVDEQEVKRFNWRRENNKGKTFNLTQLKTLLKEMGYVDNGNFITCLTSGVNPPIVRVSRGVYTFAKNPVYIDRLQKVWSDYADYGNKTKQSAVEEKVEVTSISQAIELLKKHGFKIYKPTMKYEEV